MVCTSGATCQLYGDNSYRQRLMDSMNENAGCSSNTVILDILEENTPYFVVNDNTTSLTFSKYGQKSG